MNVDKNLNNPEPQHGAQIDLEGYALDILEDDERAEIERMLTADPQLRAELRAIEQTIGQVGAAVPRETPPTALRDRLLQDASDLRQAPEPVSLTQRIASGWRFAAAFLILLLGGASIYLYTEVDERDDRIAELETALWEQADPGTDEGNESTPINFEQPLIWHQLTPHAIGEGAQGYLCYTEDGQIGYIIVLGMPVDSSEVVQLWLMDDGQRMSGGTFRPDDAGRGFLFFRAPGQSLATFDRVGLTLEPSGGSEAPTSDPIFTGEIPS